MSLKENHIYKIKFETLCADSWTPYTIPQYVLHNDKYISYEFRYVGMVKDVRVKVLKKTQAIDHSQIPIVGHLALVYNPSATFLKGDILTVIKPEEEIIYEIDSQSITINTGKGQIWNPIDQCWKWL